MADWVKLGTYTAYASIFVSVLSIAFHVYVGLLYCGALELSDRDNRLLGEIKRYVGSPSVGEAFDWIAIDCIRIFTSVLLIMGLKEENCEAIYFWIQFKLAVLVVFASIVLGKYKLGRLDILELAFPIVSLVMNLLLVIMAVMAWRTIGSR